MTWKILDLKIKTFQYNTILGGVFDCSNTSEEYWILNNSTFFGAFGLTFPYDRVINKALKSSGVLDWKIYHSLSLLYHVRICITEITKIGKPLVNFWSNAVVLWVSVGLFQAM